MFLPTPGSIDDSGCRPSLSWPPTATLICASKIYQSLFKFSPKLEPLPEIAPPPGVSEDAELQPQITITRRGGETVEEARVNGKLKWVRVTPVHGRSYYLIPDQSGHSMIRDSNESGLKVPLWVLFSF